MTIALVEYLGKSASALLGAPPFDAWAVERSVEEDLPDPLIHYVFTGRGVELRCDRDERISAIFIESDEWIECDPAVGVRFESTRSVVLDRLGVPAKSGAGLRDPILGDYGAWDRFSKAGYAVHVEYRVNEDRIKRITLIRGDLVP
jgi:plasmid stabilization system protein ParE